MQRIGRHDAYVVRGRYVCVCVCVSMFVCMCMCMNSYMKWHACCACCEGQRWARAHPTLFCISIYLVCTYITSPTLSSITILFSPPAWIRMCLFIFCSQAFVFIFIIETFNDVTHHCALALCCPWIQLGNLKNRSSTISIYLEGQISSHNLPGKINCDIVTALLFLALHDKVHLKQLIGSILLQE